MLNGGSFVLFDDSFDSLFVLFKFKPELVFDELVFDELLFDEFKFTSLGVTLFDELVFD